MSSIGLASQNCETRIRDLIDQFQKQFFRLIGREHLHLFGSPLPRTSVIPLFHSATSEGTTAAARVYSDAYPDGSASGEVTPEMVYRSVQKMLAIFVTLKPC